jgi:two-component system response regulator (stage 0 sporulation protein F)
LARRLLANQTRLHDSGRARLLPSPGDPNERRTRPMKTILFADDNRNIREYCRAALEDEGYRVVLARDGMDAVRTFRKETPDLAILDICMPGVNGLEAMERIKAIEPKVPVILFTAYDDDCVRDQRGSLAMGCVEKSEDLTELKRLVAVAFKPSVSESGTPSLRLGLPPASCKAESA